MDHRDLIRAGRARSLRRGIARREAAVIVLLAGMGLLLLFPYLLQRRTEARRLACQDHQLRLAKALLLAQQASGRFPGYANLQAIDAAGEPRAIGWAFPALPFVDFDAEKATSPNLHVLDRYGPEGPEATRGVRPQEFFSVLVCPDDPPPSEKQRAGWSSYVVNSGLPDASPAGDLPPDWPANGVFLDRFHERARDTYPFVTTLDYINQHDGDEYTWLLSENVDSGRWTDAGEAQVGFVWVADTVDGRAERGDRLLGINQRRGEGDGSLRFARPSSYHVGGVNVAYADGRVEFLNERVDYLVFVRAMTPDDAGLTEPGSRRPIGAPYRREAAKPEQ